MALNGYEVLKWTTFLMFVALCEGQAVQSPLYGETGTEQKLTQDTTRIDLPLGTNFPFFGKDYKFLYVSKDGLVGFSSNAHYRNRVYGKYQENYDVATDFPFAAVFHFDAVENGALVGTKNIPYKGVTEWRIVTKNSDEIRNMSNFIRSAFSGQDQFQATFALVVTWKDVFDAREKFGAECEYNSPAKECKTNTFQQVMLTDGTSSFAIFNYAKTELPTNPNMQSGFNGGNGLGWSEAIPSGQLQTANNGQSSDVLGRYVYQIDDVLIYRGGCKPQSSGSMEQLFIRQQYAGMFGGQMIDFNGPCLTPSTKITCKFGSPDGEFRTTGVVVNSMRGRCLVPKLLERGRVKVSVSTDGVSFYFSSVITIVHPSRMPSVVSLGMGWNETNSQRLTLNWKASDLTNISTALVDIVLVGYKESQTMSQWANLLNLGQGIQVSQETFTFNVPDLLCNDDCSSYEQGLVEVRLQNLTQATMHGVLARHVILGFLMNDKMTRTYGENWPHDKCVAWANKDNQDTTWLMAIPSCPCNLQQALVDIGGWQPDLGCNLYSTYSGNCRFHMEAVHCVRAVQPAMHNNDGAGNQCCYRRDGNLLYAADTNQGSTPDRSHDWGAYPYIKPNYVPSVSHWIHDVVSFYYCCLWTGYKDCDYYMDLRATRDCKSYVPPKQAMIYGQSHVMTFDGSSYRVCGVGDFILLKSEGITIEGRFQKSPFQNSTTGLILTDVGIKFSVEKVEIRLKGPTVDRSQRLLDVLVNGQFVLFDDTSMRWQDFKECAIVNNFELSNPSSSMASNFTIISHDGIGIQVASQNDMLTLLVVLPPKLKNKVNGLLGNWNGNMSDDFIPYNSSTVVTQADPYVFFSSYQLSWGIKKKQNSIVPFTVLPQNDSTLCTASSATYSFCNGVKACEFDMATTTNRTLAEATKDMTMRYTEIQRFVQPVRSCGLLDVPRSKKSSNVYTLGSTVTVQECRKGTLSGHTTYTCQSTGNNTQAWSPAVTATCAAETTEDAEIGLIVGIVVAVVVVIIIIIAVVICIMKRRSSNKGGGKKSETPNPINQANYTYSEVAKSEEGRKRGSKEESV